MIQREDSRQLVVVSLRTLIVGLAYISLLFAACIRPTSIINTLWHLVTYGTLAFGVIAAIYSSRQRRAFWIGFAIFGWLFFSLEQIPAFNTRRHIASMIEDTLPEIPPVNAFFVREATTLAQAKLQTGRTNYPNAPVGQRLVPQTQYEMDRLTAHCCQALFCAVLLLIATGGGFISRWMSLNELVRDPQGLD